MDLLHLINTCVQETSINKLTMRPLIQYQKKLKGDLIRDIETLLLASANGNVTDTLSQALVRFLEGDVFESSVVDAALLYQQTI